MRVLLTNNALISRGGSELYVRDLAIELMRRGHHPIAYSTKLGPVADDLRAATVPVIETLDSLGTPPDIIHGQHHYEALTAILRFPETPAIYYCHGWIPWQEAPLRSPRILRYVAVDEICRERLITEGEIAPEKIELLFNFFDMRQFPPRAKLPSRPRLALAFGNTFTEQQDMPILREACSRRGIELHGAGLGTGNPEAEPGRRLAGYDIVFAKARAAIEAMAVGAAVVLCAYKKMGPMVTAANFAALRQQNFGLRALSKPLDVDRIVSELDRYNADEAEEVSRLTRENCELQAAVDRIVDLYSRVIEETRRGPASNAVSVCREAARYLERWGPYYTQALDMVPYRDTWSAVCATVESRLGAGGHRDRLELLWTEAEANLAAQQSEIDDLRGQRDHLERLRTVAGANLAARQGEIDELRGHSDRLARLLAEAEANRAAQQSEINDQRGHSDQLARLLAEAEANLAARQGEIDDQRGHSDRLARLRAEAEASLAAQRSEIDELRGQRDELARLRAEAQANLAARQSEFDELRGYRDRVESLRAKTEGNLALQRSEIEELRVHRDRLELLLAKARGDLALQRSEIDELRGQRDQLARLGAEAESKLLIQRSEIDELRGHRDRLERLRAEAEANLAARQNEIDELRGSVTWRWSRQVLNNAFVKSVLGPFIRGGGDHATKMRKY